MINKNTDEIGNLEKKFSLIIEGLKHSQKIPPSIEVLIDAMDTQIKKGSDYQYGKRVKQADYYPNGIQTMNDTINSKVLRVNSLIEKYEDGGVPSNESIEDSFIDMINTSSFAVSFLRGQMDGQKSDVDFLNRENKK